MLTLGDNLPSRRGLTWRRGYERAARSAWDKDRPPFSSLCVFLSPPPPRLGNPLPSGLCRQRRSPALGLTCHPRPRVFTLHFSLIAHFCKLVSISMLHLLPFNIFARLCRKKEALSKKQIRPLRWWAKKFGTWATQKTRVLGVLNGGTCSLFISSLFCCLKK